MTNKFYTQQQIDQQASIIGQRLRGISADLTEYIDSSGMTTKERQKLATLESSKFLGTFLSSDEIPLDKAVAGSYADVDAGPEDFVQRWIFDVDSSVFVQATSLNGGGDTASTVKMKYESNLNTNAFTDSHKSILESLSNIEPADNFESFILAFNNAINSSSNTSEPSVITLKSNSTADFASLGFHLEYKVNDNAWTKLEFEPEVGLDFTGVFDKFTSAITNPETETFEMLDEPNPVDYSNYPLIGEEYGSSILKDSIHFPLTFIQRSSYSLDIGGFEFVIRGIDSEDEPYFGSIFKTKVTTLEFRESTGMGVDIVAELFPENNRTVVSNYMVHFSAS